MAFALGGNLLDFLVLAILRYGDMYGYVLTQHAKGVVNISDSTLYPVLRRLQKEGLLFTYQGRNRRYYSITQAGLLRLDAYIAEWSSYKNQIDLILSGGMRSE